MRRDGDPAGVAEAGAARWLLRILLATVVVLVGLALAATSAQADVKPNPVGASVKKLTQTGRPSAGTATKAKIKVAVRSTVPKVKNRVKAKAAPIRRVARKAAPVRTHRVARATRTVVRKAAPVRSYRATKATQTVARKAAPVRTRISTVQRKTSPGPTVRTVRKATAPKARRTEHAKTSPTKINSGPSKIIRSPVGKASTVKRSPSTDVAEVAQTGAVRVQSQTVPPVQVAGLPVVGVGAPAVVTPEPKVTVGDSVDLSAPPVGLRIPLLSLPRVTLPPTDLPAASVPGAELPRITWPHTDLPTVTSPRTDLSALGPSASDAVAAAPVPQVHPRAGPVGDPTSARRAPLETARTPQETVVGAGSTVLITTLILSSDAWTITSIGPPAMVLLDQLGQHLRAMEIPALVGSSAALIIAAAVGAAATGAVGSGSAGGGGGLAVVPAILGLPALGGLRWLMGRLRESAFGTPHRPGFSPD